MRHYRIPTSILWLGNGYREFKARNADDAMLVYRRQYPESAGHVSMANLQVCIAGEWKFASDLPPIFGGYNSA